MAPRLRLDATPSKFQQCLSRVRQPTYGTRRTHEDVVQRRWNAGTAVQPASPANAPPGAAWSEALTYRRGGARLVSCSGPVRVPRSINGAPLRFGRPARGIQGIAGPLRRGRIRRARRHTRIGVGASAETEQDQPGDRKGSCRHRPSLPRTAAERHATRPGSFVIRIKRLAEEERTRDGGEVFSTRSQAFVARKSCLSSGRRRVAAVKTDTDFPASPVQTPSQPRRRAL